ncbi:MAG: YHS domain-containing protein [Planctomycetes bacterium]|nr:YHS domain-containing protein [Planctomycetota bacterium]
MRNKILSVLFLAASSAVSAHNAARDPVCGMMIDPETAAAKAEYLGETYFFCQAEEQREFLANPAKFASALRVKRFVGGGVFIVSILPTRPEAGAPVRIRVVLVPNAGGVPDEANPVPLRNPVVRFFEVDRDRPSREERLELQPLGGNVYGTLRWIDRPGEYRCVAEASGEHGEEARAVVPFKAGAAWVDLPPADGGFTMADQHGVMRRMGKDWLAVHGGLAAEKPNANAVLDALSRMESDRRLLPKFNLHVNADAKPEFERYAAELERPLAELGARAAARDWEGARAQWRKVEAENCVKCHLKFRWDVVRDLSRFPAVQGGAR